MPATMATVVMMIGWARFFASATMAAMFPNRHWLGLGSGEALNEHIVGDYCPETAERIARHIAVRTGAVAGIPRGLHAVGRGLPELHGFVAVGPHQGQLFGQRGAPAHRAARQFGQGAEVEVAPQAGRAGPQPLWTTVLAASLHLGAAWYGRD